LTASVHGLLVQWGGVPMKGVVAIPSVVGVSIPIENMIENVWGNQHRRDPSNYNKL
jgi:hypothetical protein